MRSRAWAIVACALLAFVLPTVLPALAITNADIPPWQQSAGDPQHTGLAPITKGTLDVVHTFRLAPKGQTIPDGGDFGLAVLDGGAFGLSQEGPVCHLFHVAVQGHKAERTDLGAAFDCLNGGRLVGLDATNGRLLVCIDGPAAGSPLGPTGLAAAAVRLQAFGLDGSPAWSIAPQPDASDVTSLLAQAQQDGVWHCRGTALARGQAIVPFASDTGQNAVTVVALGEGKRIWEARVPATAFLPNVTFPIPAGLPAPPGIPGQLPQPGGFVPTSVTVTDDGVVVSGRLGGAAAAGSPPGIVWFGNDASGDILGATTVTSCNTGNPTSCTPAVTTGTTTPASVRPTARGPFAAQLIGDKLYVINPGAALQAEPRQVPGASGSTDLPGPSWTREGILVPVDTGIFLVDKSARLFSQWSDDDISAHVQQIVATPSAQALALVTHAGGDRPVAELVRLGLRNTLRIPVIDRIPLPLRAQGDGLSLHMVPLAEDRLIVWDDSGLAALLESSPVEPPVTFSVDSDYPETQAQLGVEVGYPDQPNVTMLLSWGDEYPEPGSITPGETVSHTYADAGDHDVRLTAVYPNNNTATTVHTVHVGGTAPNCGILCKAFRPANQNYTFFFIGISITLLGAGFTALAATRGRRRLERYLRELDRIRQEGRGEPMLAIRDLHEFRAGLRGDLGGGKLQDGQFALIDRQATEILTVLRQRILGAFIGRVSDAFRQTLDLALLDGVIEERERTSIIEAAKAEKGLAGEERLKLVELIRGWKLA